MARTYRRSRNSDYRLAVAEKHEKLDRLTEREHRAEIEIAVTDRCSGCIAANLAGIKTACKGEC